MAGIGWGALATVAMSVPMLAATATGISPMPKPVPMALVSHGLGAVPEPGAVALAATAHLAYGAAAGALLAGLFRRVTVLIGVAYATVLWALMGLVWLPYLGWGPFGTAETPKIAIATLVLHVVYGATLGLLLDRSQSDGGGRR
ncbi:hypothetical protein CDO52_15960 [Nocardiopsis gilva YIM 90087]|uniref:DUF1440 domain-containing protein n=1 Tax=Nocardiopsis gilva YIM 90087 TaxID=1235441 RepID=A0A223S7I8_9ACTN|nr:hypothetical protein CDO52_15960 [Nocardiopsis gilva YIM 90087]